MGINEKIVEDIKNLTDVQREAVSWDEGPLLVLAGPGSGKTRVLTLRITRILMESAVDNFRVLGLTFTNKAADEMRSRIRQLIPGMDKRLYLGTFHSFCAEVLRNHGSHVSVKPDFTIYSENQDLDEILSEVYDNLLKSNSVGYLNVPKVLPVIQYLKSKLVYPSSNLDIHIRETESRASIQAIYQGYEDKLKELNVLDFNSLIMKTHELFSKYPFIAKHYRTVYPYICIDEFQDTNQGQYELIRSLTKDKHNNLFIVADDDQVIYQWNGANAFRVEEFRIDYKAQVIQLPENFRCPPEVVQLANNLILYNVNRSLDKKPLEAKKPIQESYEVNLKPFASSLDESIWVAKEIQNKILGSNKTFAVIARNRKLLQPIYENLKSLSVPVIMAQRKNEFESPLILWLHYLLRLANKRNDRKFLSRVVSNYNTILNEKLHLDEVMAWSKARDGDYLRGFFSQIKLQALSDGPLLKSLEYDLVEGKDFFKFIQSGFAWLDRIVNNNEPDKENNELDNAIEANYNVEKQVWNDLVSSILARYDKEELTIGAFLQEFDLLSKEVEPNEKIVQCLTIHSSKGKEFDNVFLVGMVEDELPSFQSTKKGDESIEMEEERRNCFVAITRTRETLTMTYAKRYNGWNKNPSRFLFEMGVLKEGAEDN